MLRGGVGSAPRQSGSSSGVSAGDSLQQSCTLFQEPLQPGSTSTVSDGKRASTSGGSTSASKSALGTLSLDKAAFLLIRIRRAFRKKKAKNNLACKQAAMIRKQKPPLLRARTLPAIISPSLNIIQAQLDTEANGGAEQEKVLKHQERSQAVPSLGEKHGKKVARRVTRTSSSKANQRDSQLKFSLLVEQDDKEDAVPATTDIGLSPAVSPRHSVSSNSSNGSNAAPSATTTSKKSAGFTKLARLLTQQRDKNPEKTPQGSTVPSSDSTNDVSCFSWNKSPVECGAVPQLTTGESSSSLKKSSSVDSLLDAQLAKSQAAAAAAAISISIRLTEPETISRGDLKSSLLSPIKCIGLQTGPQVGPEELFASSLQRRKFASSASFGPTSPGVHGARYSITSVSGCRQGSIDFQSYEPFTALTKVERKHQEKLNKFNFHLQALFSAVEHEQVDRARSLLETSDVDVNCVNTDGFSALDIAVMTLNVPMVRLLESRGAKESSYFLSKESRAKHLINLRREAERSVDDINGSILIASTSGNLSTSLLKEKEKQLAFWCRRLELLQSMIKGYESIDCPDPPSTVQLEVVGTVSLKVRFWGPKTANFPRLLVTKYRIEWSTNEKFDEIVGFREMTDLNRLEVVIYGLTTGQRYYSRVCAGNMKGYSAFCLSPPATPSSWRDLHQSSLRSLGEKLSTLEELFQNIIDSRPKHAAEVKAFTAIEATEQQQPSQRKGQMRKSIKYLFGPTPKFQKAMKRGVYLGCLFYSEDKRILVTNEDNLPIIEIDESHPSSSWNNDFHWLLKISSTWEDIKTIRLELEKSHSSSSAHFRAKLLWGVEQLQTALGTQDLGQLHCEPLRDSEGTTVICCVKQISDPKCISSLSVRWLPLAKFRRKQTGYSGVSPENSDSSMGMTAIRDLLHSSLEDMISYNKSSRSQLPRGLYLGYLKLNSSVDVIRVLATKAAPNVLPYARIRENPHVSRDEWEWLCSFKALDRPHHHQQQQASEQSDVFSSPLNISQLKFAKSLVLAAKALQRSLHFSALDTLRLADAEVVEFGQDVSFVMLLPPLELVCTLPGQMDHYTLRDDLIYLPIQIFETIHMNTYQHAILVKYSRISCVLEMDTTATHHAQREAFSSSELNESRSRLSQLQKFQSTADLAWKASRWLMDLINYARDKQCNGINFELLQSCLSLSAEELIDASADSSPQLIIPSICLSTPQQLEIPGKPSSSQRRTSRDDSAIGLSISLALTAKASMSASSLQLFDPTQNSPVNRIQLQQSNFGSGEMRRCASTSGLSQVTQSNSSRLSSSSCSSGNHSSDHGDDGVGSDAHIQIKSKSFDQLCLDKKSTGQTLLAVNNSSIKKKKKK